MTSQESVNVNNNEMQTTATIQTPIVEEAQPTLLQAAGVKTENITLDNDNADKRWAPYGITEAAVMFVGTDGQAYPSRRYKAVTRNGKVAAIVGANYTPIPNEVVKEQLTNAGFDWDTDKERYVRHGNGMVLELVSKELEFEVAPNDFVRAAVWVENSIDGSGSLRLSMGADRNRCWNGTILRGKALGSVAMRHYGEPKAMISFMQDNISKLYDASVNLINNMRNANRVKFMQKHAEVIHKQLDIAQKYTADVYSVSEDEKTVTLADPDMTLWQAYNAITGGLDDNSGIYHSQMNMSGKLNKINGLTHLLVRETADLTPVPTTAVV